jgi:uncharacterized membrane protein
MAYSIAFHIIGICFWMAGLLILTRVMAVSESPSPALIKTVKRLWFGYALPGAVLVVITGINQILFRGMAYYFAAGQGWFHGKITAVIILLVMTALIWKEVTKFAAGNIPNKKMLSAFHGVSALLLIILVILTETNIAQQVG